MSVSTTWNEIWDSRTAPASSTSVLNRLMIGSGLDSGFAPFDESAWLEHVQDVAQVLRIEPGESVFEVGCGAGAFLYELSRRGVRVAGIDRSPALVQTARQVIPDGEFSVVDAAALSETPRYDVVLSESVFQYFASTDYALEVLRRMVAKADRAVALLDLPDLATKAESIAERERLAGGAEAYAQRYAGLEHLYFDRDQVTAALTRCGLRDVQVQAQRLDGHDNARFRFNVWGFR